MINIKSEVHNLVDKLEVEASDTVLQSGRNLVTVRTLSDNRKVVIKSFKEPNLINKIVYRFFRKSKAKRSYEFASILIKRGIGTPLPILYKENFDFLGLKESYYVSFFVNSDLTYRELTTDFSISDHEEILRAFTRFTYQLHEKGINFLDHSPGNTLIEIKNDGGYKFYLVDLNRMRFGRMNFETRMKNFSKLTIHKSIIEVMSNEYALCTGEKEEDIFNLMWYYTRKFQHKYYRKIRLKKAIFFWKKKYKTISSKSPI